ncbi:MAG: metal-dependent hydrolase, partial [Elusimicrobia bacterium]|nr:metal-dependent hydrolase [Elusimicrobiota bacterium]
SLFGFPLLAVLAAFLFHRCYPHLSWMNIFGLCFLGMGVHVFFDLLNSYGVVLLYPFSLMRFELAWVFIIDLALWTILLAPLPLSRIRGMDLERLSRIALVSAGIYVALCGAARVRAAHVLDKIVQDQKIQTDFSYVFPEAFGPHRFRGVLRRGDEYQMYLIHVFTGKSELKATYSTDENLLAVQKIRTTEKARKLEWFFKAPVWRAYPSEVEIFDLRFHSTVLSRGTPFSFRFAVPVLSP